MLDESRLHRMQLVGRAKTLDGGYPVVLMLDRQAEAAVDAHVVDDDRAGTALAVIASFLGPRQMQVLSKEVEKGRARIQFPRAPLPGDTPRHGCSGQLYLIIGSGCGRKWRSRKSGRSRTRG